MARATVDLGTPGDQYVFDKKSWIASTSSREASVVIS